MSQFLYSIDQATTFETVGFGIGFTTATVIAFQRATLTNFIDRLFFIGLSSEAGIYSGLLLYFAWKKCPQLLGYSAAVVLSSSLLPWIHRRIYPKVNENEIIEQ